MICSDWHSTGSTRPDCNWTMKFRSQRTSHMEPSATSTMVTGPVGERLQAGTEDAPVLDRPPPLRHLHDSGAGYKCPDLLTYLLTCLLTCLLVDNICVMCRVRAVIKEDAKSPGDTICREPRQPRRRLVYVSRGSLVEVRLATGNRVSTSGVTSSSRSSADRRAQNPAEYFLVEFEGLITTSSFLSRNGISCVIGNSN